MTARTRGLVCHVFLQASLKKECDLQKSLFEFLPVFIPTARNVFFNKKQVGRQKVKRHRQKSNS